MFPKWCSLNLLGKLQNYQYYLKVNFKAKFDQLEVIRTDCNVGLNNNDFHFWTKMPFSAVMHFKKSVVITEREVLNVHFFPTTTFQSDKEESEKLLASKNLCLVWQFCAWRSVSKRVEGNLWNEYCINGTETPLVIAWVPGNEITMS